MNRGRELSKNRRAKTFFSGSGPVCFLRERLARTDRERRSGLLGFVERDHGAKFRAGPEEAIEVAVSVDAAAPEKNDAPAAAHGAEAMRDNDERPPALQRVDRE